MDDLIRRYAAANVNWVGDPAGYVGELQAAHAALEDEMHRLRAEARQARRERAYAIEAYEGEVATCSKMTRQLYAARSELREALVEAENLRRRRDELLETANRYLERARAAAHIRNAPEAPDASPIKSVPRPASSIDAEPAATRTGTEHDAPEGEDAMFKPHTPDLANIIACDVCERMRTITETDPLERHVILHGAVQGAVQAALDAAPTAPAPAGLVDAVKLLREHHEWHLGQGVDDGSLAGVDLAGAYAEGPLCSRTVNLLSTLDTTLSGQHDASGLVSTIIERVITDVIRPGVPEVRECSEVAEELRRYAPTLAATLSGQQGGAVPAKNLEITADEVQRAFSVYAEEVGLGPDTNGLLRAKCSSGLRAVLEDRARLAEQPAPAGTGDADRVDQPIQDFDFTPNAFRAKLRGVVKAAKGLVIILPPKATRDMLAWIEDMRGALEPLWQRALTPGAEKVADDGTVTVFMSDCRAALRAVGGRGGEQQ
jgi:hypothetical protein